MSRIRDHIGINFVLNLSLSVTRLPAGKACQGQTL